MSEQATAIKAQGHAGTTSNAIRWLQSTCHTARDDLHVTQV